MSHQGNKPLAFGLTCTNGLCEASDNYQAQPKLKFNLAELVLFPISPATHPQPSRESLFMIQFQHNGPQLWYAMF